MKEKGKYPDEIHIFTFVNELFGRKRNELFHFAIENNVFYCKMSTRLESVF